jgi:hypothetical protein
VSKEQLIASSLMHKEDMAKALGLFSALLAEAAVRHDYDKISLIDWFHSDFASGFKQTGWWDNHRKINRHHLKEPDGIPEDVNLIDVLDHIADCVMAGLARSGSVYEISLPDALLQRAFQNTVELLKTSTEVAAAKASEVVHAQGPPTGTVLLFYCTGCGDEWPCDGSRAAKASEPREHKHGLTYSQAELPRCYCGLQWPCPDAKASEEKA